MKGKSTIAYLIEDSDTIVRLSQHGWIDSGTTIDALAQIHAEITAQRKLAENEKSLLGPTVGLPAILEGLAIRQLVNEEMGIKGGSYVL